MAARGWGQSGWYTRIDVYQRPATVTLRYVTVDLLSIYLSVMLLYIYLCRCFGAPACRVFPDHTDHLTISRRLQIRDEPLP